MGCSAATCSNTRPSATGMRRCSSVVIERLGGWQHEVWLTHGSLYRRVDCKIVLVEPQPRVERITTGDWSSGRGGVR